MYRPPMNSGIQRYEHHHRQPEREEAVLRRQHRVHLAAERAKERDEQHALKSGAHRITRPAAAIWALVSPRR